MSTTASTPRRPSSRTTGTPPPTPAYHRPAAFEKAGDFLRLDDFDRVRGGDDATVRALPVGDAGRLERLRLGLRLGVERADGFRRVVEGRVVGVDYHLRHERHRHRSSLAVERLLQQIADLGLRLRDQHVERVLWRLARRRLLDEQVPHLRAVAVREHESVRRYRVGECRHRRFDRLALFGRRPRPVLAE
nr:hypothetical protein [Haloplanus vescus]